MFEFGLSLKISWNRETLILNLSTSNFNKLSRKRSPFCLVRINLSNDLKEKIQGTFGAEWTYSVVDTHCDILQLLLNITRAETQQIFVLLSTVSVPQCLNKC